MPETGWFLCSICGSIVWSHILHDAWHEENDDETEDDTGGPDA